MQKNWSTAVAVSNILTTYITRNINNWFVFCRYQENTQYHFALLFFYSVVHKYVQDTQNDKNEWTVVGNILFICENCHSTGCFSRLHLGEWKSDISISLPHACTLHYLAWSGAFLTFWSECQNLTKLSDIPQMALLNSNNFKFLNTVLFMWNN